MGPPSHQGKAEALDGVGVQLGGYILPIQGLVDTNLPLGLRPYVTGSSLPRRPWRLSTQGDVPLLLNKGSWGQFPARDGWFQLVDGVMGFSIIQVYGHNRTTIPAGGPCP